MRTNEKKLAPGLQIRGKAQQQAIAKADAALKAYTKKIASRETKLNNEQKARTAKLTADLQKYERNLPAALKAWEAKINVKTVWSFLDPSKLTTTAAGKLVKQKDKSILATGVNRNGEYRLESTTDLTGLRAIRLEVLTDKRLPKNGPGRAPDGNFVLTELELFAAPKSDPTKKVKLKLINAQADFSQANYNVKTAIDGSEAATNNGWAVASQTGKNHVAVFEFQKLIGHKTGTIITVVMKHQIRRAHV